MNEPALKYELEWSMVHPDILDECWEDCAKLLTRSVSAIDGEILISLLKPSGAWKRIFSNRFRADRISTGLLFLSSCSASGSVRAIR